MNKEQILHIKNARQNNPDGKFCGFCGKYNYFADEYGFFYIMSPFIMWGIVEIPCCEDCYWKFGDNHRRLFGVGER